MPETRDWFISSAFETDWDLVEAQKSGLIDAVVSGDGVPFMLGVDNIVFKLNYRNGQCCIYRRSDVLSLPTMANGGYSNK